MLKTALEIHPKNFQTLQNLGTFLFDQGKDEEAVCAYKSALALETNHVETLNALGDLLGRQGHHDEAAETYRKSLASNPVQPRVLSKLGDLLGKVGAWGGSVVFHRRASALDPDDMNTLGQLALAENLSGHSPAETLHRMIQIPATKRADVAMKMWAALTLNLPEKAFSFTSPKFNTLPYDSLSRFYKPDLDARLAELPALKGAWPRPDTGPVIYAAASGDYAEIFAQDFVSSVLSKSPDAAVHLHVMNPAGYDAAEALGGFPKSRLTWSFEDIGDCPKTLYSTRRFVRLAQFILGVEQRFMAVDVDSVFNGDASLALGELGAFDVALYPREREPFANQMVSAGVIALSPTTGGRDFAQFLAAYILHFDSLGTSQWFLDQLAIVSARAWFNNNAAGVIIKNMPQNTIDWSEHYRHDSLIWTLKGGEKTNIIREGVRGDSFSPADQRLPGVT